MANVMMQLGDFKFSVSTAAYSELQRSTSYRWSSVERIERSAARQAIGAGSDTITLSGTIHTVPISSIKQLDILRAEAAKCEPLMLVDGLGNVHGKWAIVKIDETQSYFLKDGIPRVQDFTLTLEFVSAS